MTDAITTGKCGCANTNINLKPYYTKPKHLPICILHVAPVKHRKIIFTLGL